jgi:hypothetical protein
MKRGTAVVLALACVLAASSAARAEDRPRSRDASYGRFDGDLAIAAAAAMTLGARGPRAGADVRLRYLSTAGVFGSYEDGEIVGSAAEPRRVLAVGAELRPLFLGRWATGREIGSPRIDLLVDSLAIELGAAFAQPGGARLGARAALQAGLGLELPLLAQVSGPFVGLHGGARWSERTLSGGPADGPSDRALFFTITLGWQATFGGPIVDQGDRRRAASSRYDR